MYWLKLSIWTNSNEVNYLTLITIFFIYNLPQGYNINPHKVDASLDFRLFLKFTSLVTLLIGLIFFIFPAQAVHFFTGLDHPRDKIFVMFLGSSLSGYSMLNWQASNHSAPSILRPVFLGNFTALIIAWPLSIYALVTRQLNNYGLLILLIHLSFGIGFGYFLKRLPVNPQLN